MHSRLLPRIALGLSLAAVLGLAGCATTATSKVKQSVDVNHYRECYQPVSYLRQSDERMKKAVAQGAVTGGLLGALAGGLMGGDNRGEHALIGAAAGAIAGGFAGYYQEKQRQIADDNERIESYGADLSRTSSEYERTIRLAQEAQNCYQARYTELMSSKANGMASSEGRARLKEIISGLKETNQLMAAVDGRMGTDLNNYEQAYEQDLGKVGLQRNDVAATVGPVEVAPIAQTPAAKPAPAAKPTPKPAAVASAKPVSYGTQNTERKLQEAKARQAESKAVAQRGDTMVRDICSNPDVGDWGPTDLGCTA